MNIYGAVRRDFKRRRRQDQSVRRDHQRIRPRGSDAFARMFVLQGMRLKDLQAARGGKLLDGTRRCTHSPARWPVRLRQNQRDVVPGIEQRRQRTRGKLWSTGEC